MEARTYNILRLGYLSAAMGTAYSKGENTHHWFRETYPIALAQAVLWPISISMELGCRRRAAKLRLKELDANKES